MREINKAYLLELYELHDQLACAVSAAGAALVHGGDLVAEINRADELADQLETKFAEVLTPEERGELPDEEI